MLKRHQAIIDLDKNVLRIHGQEVRFLSEHELPAKARWEEGEEAKSPLEGGSAAQGAIHPATSLHPAVPPGGLSQPVLGPAAVSTPAPPSSSGTSGVGAARPTAHSEEKIKMLVDLGIARQEAIAALDITGGDADSAAGMLFH
ncbi:hypothetical protein DFS34DRAFT_270840 [Phlyctochytrium arcticum]|nr:hypothetical protein DFS34DRAFT_270840 [Phlyctochytrium arcticum]